MRGALIVFLLGISFGIAAQDAPRRKSGLWEITMSGGQMPRPMTMQQCVDEKTDDMSKAPGPGRQECGKPVVRREGGRTTVEAECKVEGSIAKTRAVFTGDMNSAYKGDIATTFTPPMHGITEQKMTLEGRWLGPSCASQAKPGAAAGMPGGMPGSMDAETARRMAEELRKQYGK